MASVITIAGEQLFAAKAQANEQLDIDTFIFANVPNQDPSAPINREEGIPTAHIVYQQNVQQVGRINDNVVVYSTVLDSITGPFEFNWVGLYSSVNQKLVAINHVPTVTKTATAPGEAGNTLNRNFGIEYSGIAALTNITVDAETWQLNFTARLSGMDLLTQQLAADMNGKDWFIDDGLKVVPRATANTFSVTPGVGYVSGLRVELKQEHILIVQSYPQFVYVDAWFSGNANSTWSPQLAFTVTNTEMDDYIDPSGTQHYVYKLAVINAADDVGDLRNTSDTASKAWTNENTVITVDTFSLAMNGTVKAKRLRTICHTNLGTGAAEYIYIDTDVLKSLEGDEFEFWNLAGHHYKLNHNRTISIEQFGAIDDGDIMPVLAKALPLFKKGIVRVKSEGGDYELGDGEIVLSDFSSSEIDFRKANIKIKERLSYVPRIVFENPTSLEVKINEVDYAGSFSHQVMQFLNPKRLRIRIYDEVKNACYPSPDYVVNNLSSFIMIGGGSDIRIKFTEFYNMFRKNYDGTIVDRNGLGGEHLGRCIEFQKLGNITASKRVKISGGAVTECRTPLVLHEVDNLTINSIDFTIISDNSIYDLGCNNTVYNDMTFVDCQDEGIVFKGTNKKFSELRFYNVSNKCLAISGVIKACVIDNCSFRADVNVMPLNAIKTRVETEGQSSDLTVSNSYFEGKIDFAVNYIKNIDKLSFNNKCRFKIVDDVGGRVIATFGNVGLLDIGNCDFEITGISSHANAVLVTGNTKLRTYDNEGLLESYLNYPDGAKLPVEFRDKKNIDPSIYSDIGEYKGNTHYVAPTTGGMQGRGYAMSFAFDINTFSGDSVKTAGFIRVVKQNSNNQEASCRFEFWTAKNNQSGYELIGVIDNQNKLLPAVI